MASFHTTTQAWNFARLERDYAANKRATVALVEAALKSKKPPSIAAFSSRESIAYAVDYLSQGLRKSLVLQGCKSEPLAILFDPPSDRLLAFFSARTWAVIPYEKNSCPGFTREDLQKLANGKAKVKPARARVALAFGFGDCTWSAAEKTTRMAYVLRLLALSMRERAS